MSEEWYLSRVSDFMLLLCKRDETRNVLSRRLKKEPEELSKLYLLIEKLDKMGYANGIDFAFATHRIDTIKEDKHLGLIELRVDKSLWRVICYWDKKRECIVILDAFKAHQHKRMSEIVASVERQIEIVQLLLEEVC